MVRYKSITLLCAYCDIPFLAYPSTQRKGSRAFCCWDHRHAGATALHVVAMRFWEKVAQCDHGEQCTACCWPWLGARMQDGYGKFYYAPEGEPPRYIRAHRFAWFLAYGRFPEPEGCHDCPMGDNPLCVNFHHIWEGNQAENIADAAKKGRMLSGEANGASAHKERMPRGITHYKAQRTEAQVRIIHELTAQGWTQVAIGKHLDIDKREVWKIVHGHTWAHIKEEFDKCSQEQYQRN